MRTHCHPLLKYSILIIAVGISATALISGCAQDEPIGRTSETTKKVVETPTEKTTTTETKQKDTRYVR